MGHHCACRPSKRESDRSVSTEASNGVVTLAAVGLLPSNPRLERTGRPTAHHGRAARAAGRSAEGLSYLQEAKQIDPYFDPSWFWPYVGIAHFVQHEYGEAVANLSR